MDTNLISENDLTILKIKLGKSKRNQKDWDWISGLLAEHDVVVPVYAGEKNANGKGNAIVIDEMALAFTSREECSRQMEVFAKEMGSAVAYEMEIRWKSDRM